MFDSNLLNWHFKPRWRLGGFASSNEYTLNVENFGRFFMKFRTIFKGISDEYNLLYSFQNFTYFEDLQNVTV